MARFSEERIAPANGIEIAYQEMGDPGAPPLLLIMGLAMQMVAWPEEFCSMLAERGFRVIRFDNRDIGRSTQIKEAGLPKRLDLFIGRRETAAYRLQDMAGDTVGLMDHLGIEAAHLVGASMGGMIAQVVALDYPERVLSLTSMLSTTGRRWVGLPSWKAFAALMARFPKERDAFVERAVKTFEVIGSPGYPMDEELVRGVAAKSFDRSPPHAGILRQMHAVSAAEDRTRRLRRLRVPTTVIHGASDPLVRPAAGRATARAIPGSHLRIFEGMGHDLPRELWPEIVDEIARNAARARPAATARQAA